MTKARKGGVWAAFVVALLVASPHQHTKAAEAPVNPLWPAPRSEPAWSEQQREAGYAIWTADFAVPFFQKIPPLAEQLAAAPKCVSTPGEHEPLVIGIWALRDLGTVHLGASSSRFKIKTSHVLFDNRLVPPPPVEHSRRLGIPFFLPEEAEAQLRAGENTVFWLTLFVPPDVPAGTYKETLVLQFSGEADERIEIPYTVEVLPFKLPGADISFGMYYQPFRMPEAYRSADYDRQYLEDMAAHGHTSAWIPSPSGEFGFDQTGKVKLSGSKLERGVEARLKAGLIHKDIPVMMHGHAPWDHPGTFTEWAKQLKIACAKREWPEMILYGPDEPDTRSAKEFDKKHGEGAYMKHFEDLGAARSHMRTITAIGGDYVDEFGEYLSVWVVVGGTITPKTLRLAKELDSELWTYHFGMRGTNPVFHRHFPGLYTWSLGLKGNFLWAYSHDAKYSWEGKRTSPHSYVSLSKAGPVTTVGWEARREGIEDYRYLSYLEHLVGQHVGDQVAAEASEWLKGLRERGRRWEVFWEWRKWSKNRWDLADLWNPYQGIKPEEYQLIREKAQEYIAALLKTN